MTETLDIDHIEPGVGAAVQQVPHDTNAIKQTKLMRIIKSLKQWWQVETTRLKIKG